MSFSWWSLSGSLFQRVGVALQKDLASEHFLLAFLPNPEMLSLHREQIWREQDGLYWETSSCRRCGGVLCTHWQVRQSILYSICLVIGNQCNDRRTGVMCSWDFVLVIICAAAFWIFCRWFNWSAGRPQAPRSAVTIAKPEHNERHCNGICCILSQGPRCSSCWDITLWIAQRTFSASLLKPLRLQWPHWLQCLRTERVKTVNMGSFLETSKIFQTLHDDNLHRALQFHTSFGNLDQILKSQQHQKE